MKVSKFQPIDGYLVVRKPSVTAATESGFEVEVNDDDLLAFAEVVVSGSLSYRPAETVVFRDLEAQSFRDGAEEYLLVHESDVVGTLKP